MDGCRRDIMASLDIRNQDGDKVTNVVFAEAIDCENVTHLYKDFDVSLGSEGYSLRIQNECDATNLIKALQYAIDNKWWD